MPDDKSNSAGAERRRRRRRNRPEAALEPVGTFVEPAGGGKRHRHRSRHGWRGRWKRIVGSGWYFLAAVGLMAVAMVLNMHDSSLRRPDSDDMPGDPPTMFLFWAVLAAVAGLALIVGGLARKREE